MNVAHLAQFRAPLRRLTIDPAAGVIGGASLITAGQPKGWPLWIDSESLRGFAAQLAEKKVLKAYLTHGSGADRTGAEIGFWDNFRLDGESVRADFHAFDAWRRHSPEQAEKLFEMASKVDTEFGVSLVFHFTTAWARTSGAELATRKVGSIDGVPAYDPPRPADCRTAFPSVRVTEVMSGDFVDDPAANTGLLRAGNAKTATQSAEEQLHRLRAEAAAIRGTDASSLAARAEIGRAIIRLRDGGIAAVDAYTAASEEIPQLEAELQNLSPSDPAGARRRGVIAAKLSRLRAVT